MRALYSLTIARQSMEHSPYDPWRKYTSPVFDPLSVTGSALAALGGGNAALGGAAALTGIGHAVSAANTIAGGSYEAQSGQMKQALADFGAAQDVQNAAGAVASAQRQAFDTTQKTNLMRSTAVANAAASGIDAGSGSAVTNQAEITGRGQLQSAMDLWSGQNQATNLINQAAGKRYSGYMDWLGGQEAQRASYLNAISTIAGGGASIMRMYGSNRFGSRGNAGIAES
jgi:hypothetical protein